MWQTYIYIYVHASKSARLLLGRYRGHHSRDGVLLPPAIFCELYLTMHLQREGLKLSSRPNGLACSGALLLLLEPCPRGALELS